MSGGFSLIILIINKHFGSDKFTQNTDIDIHFDNQYAKKSKITKIPMKAIILSIYA